MAPPDEKETGDAAGKTEQLKVPQIPWVRDRLFYGWIIVLVGAATQFLQGTVNQGFTTYLGPLQRDFGWSRAVLAGPRSITSVQNSIFGPVEGFLMDRFGPRNMSVTGVFIMGLGLILFGLANSIWMYYAASIVIALGTVAGEVVAWEPRPIGFFVALRVAPQSAEHRGPRASEYEVSTAGTFDFFTLFIK